MSEKPQRVFVGLRDVGGFYSGLKTGLDEISVESAYVNLGHQPFQYRGAANPYWAQIISRIGHSLARLMAHSWITRAVWVVVLQNVFGLVAFLFAIGRYDVFVLGSYSSFFFFLDYPILRLFGKKLIIIFHGSDTRPAYMNGYVFQNANLKNITFAIALARIQKTLLIWVEHLADAIVDIPPQSHFLTKPFVSGWYVGLPVKPEGIGSTAAASAKPRILHAPAKRATTGSIRIRAMIEHLRAKGLDFDFIELTGAPRVKILHELALCDFVIDELYADTPMTIFAAEAATFGKPAVLGGYLSRELAEYLPPSDTPPVLFCDPDEMESAIERMITDAPYRREMGAKAKAFVSDQWSPRKVAERILKLASGEVPVEWKYDPAHLRYTHGCGMPLEAGRNFIDEVYRNGGDVAFCLKDKPALLARFKEPNISQS